LRAAELDRVRALDAHGDRVEVRTLEVTTMLTGYLDRPGAAQVCRVRSEVKARGGLTTEVSYAITSVPRERAGAATLLGWHRGHWGIENRAHYVRDVTMGEDANRTWSGSGPQVLAALRNAALNQLRMAGSSNIAASLRRNAARVGDLLKSLRILKN
jgi:hypothetical protein